VADAVAALRQAIVSGEMAPGSGWSSPSLAEMFGVSRGAVRAALIRLTGEGLVERVHTGVPGSGWCPWPRGGDRPSAARCWEALCAAEAARNVTAAAAAELTEWRGDARPVSDGDPLSPRR